MRSRATVQSPAAYANLNLQRGPGCSPRGSKLPLCTLAGGGLIGLTDADLVFGFEEGDIVRYGAVLDGNVANPTASTDDRQAIQRAWTFTMPAAGSRTFRRASPTSAKPAPMRGR